MSRPWDPWGGKSEAPRGDVFGQPLNPPQQYGQDPFGSAEQDRDPFGAGGQGGQRQDPWGADPFGAQRPYNVPTIAAAGPAPARGDTGRYRITSGLRRPQTAAVYGSYQQTFQSPTSYGAPPASWSTPAASAPAPAPSPVPENQWSFFGTHAAQPIAAKKSAVVPIVVSSVAGLIAVIVVVAAVVIVAKKHNSPMAQAPSTPALTPEQTVTSQPSYPSTTPWYSTTARTYPTSTEPQKPTGEAALGSNPLFADFDAGLAKQVCNSTGWPSDVGAAQIFYDGVLQCLSKGWRPLVASTRLTFQTPSVAVPAGATNTSPCGTVGPNTAAFYCSTNHTLYMPQATMQIDQYGNQPIIYISVLAHEFGHHIQALTGILTEAHQEEQTVGRDSAAGLELSRRVELEAQCFSGMFVGSIVDSGGMFTQTEYQKALKDSDRGDGYRRGSPPDHGTNAHAQAWWRQGASKNHIGECNTWRAAGADVS